jgi:hypothetical protein
LPVFSQLLFQGLIGIAVARKDLVEHLDDPIYQISVKPHNSGKGIVLERFAISLIGTKGIYHALYRNGGFCFCGMWVLRAP